MHSFDLLQLVWSVQASWNLDVCNVVSFSLQHAAHKIRTQAPLQSKKVNSAVTELALSRVGHEFMSYLRLQAQSRPPAIPSTISFYNVKLECTHSIYFSWFGRFKQAGTWMCATWFHFRCNMQHTRSARKPLCRAKRSTVRLPS